jgi:hypothetical protein
MLEEEKKRAGKRKLQSKMSLHPTKHTKENQKMSRARTIDGDGLFWVPAAGEK